jgi:hypothetical protein
MILQGPFSIQSEKNRVVATHYSIGIEPRIFAECITLLDTQVSHRNNQLHCSNTFSFFSSYLVLGEIIRSDGSLTIYLLSG